MSFLELLRMMKIRVPEDISIVRHDDSLLSEISEVKLTSIVIPKSERAESAVNIIKDLVKLQNKNMDAFSASSKIYELELIN